MSKVYLSKLKPIRDNIVLTDMEFGEEKTASGIYIPSQDGKSEGVKSRWGKVHSVGPQQEDVKPGEWALFEHGRWSRGFTVLDDDGNEIIIRRGDPKAILAVADEKPNEIIYSNVSTSKVQTFTPDMFAR